MISKTKAIAALEELKGDCTGQIAMTIEDCQKVIGEMEDDGWIPVTERLPEHDNNVLVIVTDRFSNIKLEHAYLLANYEHDCGWILEMFPEIENPGVTHWMPLPDMPKEVQG